MQRTLLALASIAALHAQQPDIRVNVDLVQIEAVVTDAKGRHVPGLAPEDFRLTVDGKVRRVSALSFVDGSPEPATGALQPDDVRRAIVFMVDETHTSPENFAQLLPVMRRFVDEKMGPRDLVSVMATRNNLGFFERFTSDKQQVRAGLNRLLRLVGDSYDLIHDQRPFTYDRPGLVNLASAFMMEARHGLAMSAIERALAGLRDMPGRKAVFLLSDGIEFPLEQLNPRIGSPQDPEVVLRMKRRTQEVATLAGQSGVVFYTFDLKTLDPFFTDARRRTNLQTVPYMLAHETGGIFVQNANGLTEAVGKAMDDMTGYYLLGFYPSSDESLQGRRVNLTVRQPGLSVRARSGLRLIPPADARPASREEAMRRAVFSPFAGAMRLRLTPVYSASPPGKKGERQSLVRVLLSLDGRDLTWQPAANGKKTAVLDAAVAVFAADNKVAGSKDQRYTIEATDAQAVAMAASEVEYAIELGALRPGPYQFRAAVRDDSTGSAGSAGISLELPDFNQKRLAISSLVLSQPNDRQQDTRIASRNFTLGTRLNYACQIYSARTENGAAPLEVEIHLFHDGRRIFAGAPIPLAPDPGAHEVSVAGSVSLPSDLAEGEYTIQLVAHDRMPGAKPASALQSSDLVLRRPK